MSIRLIVEDSLNLYRRQRSHSALCLALIAVDATACGRYGKHGSSGKYIQSSAKRFKTFLNDETNTGRLRDCMKHGVDLPPQPDLGEPPQYEPVELDEDDIEGWIRHVKDDTRRRDKWFAEHRKAYNEFEAKIFEAGDDYSGKYIKRKWWSFLSRKRKWVSYLRRPRVVTTTGVLYESRCKLVHEGTLSAIRIAPIDDDKTLRVSGVDPIEFSSTWVVHVLGIVREADENNGLFTK